MVKILFLILSFSVYSETRQKIVVIDTGIKMFQSLSPYMCKNGRLGSNSSWLDKHGHGSNVIGLIGDKIDPIKTCIVSIKLDLGQSLTPEKDIATVMEMTEKLNPIAVNISMSGVIHYESEKQSFIRLINKGTKIIVAAGNESLNLDRGCLIYPACYLKDIKSDRASSSVSNFFVVGAKDTGSSNTGSVVTVTAVGKKQGYPVMTGTSQATANFTGKLFSK